MGWCNGTYGIYNNNTIMWHLLCKNGWTNWDAVMDSEWGGSKEWHHLANTVKWLCAAVMSGISTRCGNVACSQMTLRDLVLNDNSFVCAEWYICWLWSDDGSSRLRDHVPHRPVQHEADTRQVHSTITRSLTHSQTETQSVPSEDTHCVLSWAASHRHSLRQLASHKVLS